MFKLWVTLISPSQPRNDFKFGIADINAFGRTQCYLTPVRFTIYNLLSHINFSLLPQYIYLSSWINTPSFWLKMAQYQYFLMLSATSKCEWQLWVFHHICDGFKYTWSLIFPHLTIRFTIWLLPINNITDNSPDWYPAVPCRICLEQHQSYGWTLSSFIVLQ